MIEVNSLVYTFFIVTERKSQDAPSKKIIAVSIETSAVSQSRLRLILKSVWEALTAVRHTKNVFNGVLAIAAAIWLAGDQFTPSPVDIGAVTISSGFITDGQRLDSQEFADLFRELNLAEFGYERVGTGKIDDGVSVFVMRRQFGDFTEFVLIPSSPSYRADNPHSTIRHTLDIYGNPDPNAFELFPELTKVEVPEIITIRFRGELHNVAFTSMDFDAIGGTVFSLQFMNQDNQIISVTISRSTYGNFGPGRGWQMIAGPKNVKVATTSYQDFESRNWRSYK